MKIYDYTKYGQCFLTPLGPGVEGRLDRIIEIINDGLPFQMPKVIHPKELERLERLKTRKEDIETTPNIISIPKEDLVQEKPSYRNGVMFVVGGCNFGTKPVEYFNKKFSELNKALVKSDFHILFIRGNNDDPSYFDEEKINFSNIKTLTSNCVVQFSEYSCLCIGGGISFDREWKKEKSKEYGTPMYWENERIDFDIKEIEDAIKENNIACVISHESPSFIGLGTSEYKKNKWFKNDKNLLDDVIKCRSKLDSLYNELVKADKKPYVWWYTRLEWSSSNVVNDIVFQTSHVTDNLNSIVLKNFNKYLTSEEKKAKKTDGSSWKIDFSKADSYWSVMNNGVAADLLYRQEITADDTQNIGTFFI